MEIKKFNIDEYEFEFVNDAYPNAYNDLAAYESGLSSAVNSIKQSRKICAEMAEINRESFWTRTTC